jgi:uncharacterized protein (DUF58 family)
VPDAARPDVTSPDVTSPDTALRDTALRNTAPPETAPPDVASADTPGLDAAHHQDRRVRRTPLPRPRRAAVSLLLFALLMELLGRLVNAPLLSVLASAALGVLAADAGLTPSLRRVTLGHLAPARASAGRPAVVRVRLRIPASRFRASLLLVYRHPAFGECSTLLPPRSYRTGAVVSLRLTAQQRGHWTDDAVLEVVAPSPFGGFVRRRRFTAAADVRLHPATAPAYPDFARAVTAHGARAGRPGPAGEELAGLREWLPGDGVHGVAWRASARRNALVVVEREQPQEAGLVVALGHRDRDGDVDGDRWEQLVARAAATCLVAIHDGRRVTLVSGDRALVVATRTAALDWFADLDTAVPATAAAVRRSPADAVTTVLWLGGTAAATHAVGAGGVRR